MKKKKSIFGRIAANIARAFRRLMNIGIPLKAVLITLIIFTGATFALTRAKMLRDVGGKADYAEAMRYIEIKDSAETNYIDAVDRKLMGEAAASAMISELGDKWSYYMSPDEYETYQMSSANEYSGVGMSILKDKSTGGFQIVAVNTGSAAANAGLTSGMVITDIDGTDVVPLDYDEARTLIRSKLNVPFTVTVSSKETYTIDCSGSYVSSVTYRKEKTEAGYIQIKNFEAGTGNDCVKAVDDLLNQTINALVIDLRGNPGGLDTEIKIFLDYLLPEGTLFISANKAGDEIETVSDAICLDIPMVVLINGETFAEAEVFAACLQENDWALLMGEPTAGMTRTQETVELSDGGAMRLSTRTYLTANHVDICAQGGVIPDTIVYNSDPSTVGTTEGTTGESIGSASKSNDEQLMAALTYLSKTQF